MYLYHADKLDEGQEFIVTGDKSQLQPKVSQVWWSSDQCDSVPSRVRISARVLPTVWSEGRQIKL